MAKPEYSIADISKSEAAGVLLNWHYLSVMKLSKGFKSGINMGLFHGGKSFGCGAFGAELVGACVFTGLPVPELSESIFGLERDDQDGLYELSRLCINPAFQKTEHNLASWFVSRCLKEMKRRGARAILSYADSGFHAGTVYAAANFSFYGETDPKKDFWVRHGGSFVKHSRGKVAGVDGEWRDRSGKLRFLKVFDKSLKVRWDEEKWSNSKNHEARII